MKQRVTITYVFIPSQGMDIRKIEGTPLPDGVNRAPTSYSKEVFMERFDSWDLVSDDGQVMIFEREA